MEKFNKTSLKIFRVLSYALLSKKEISDAVNEYENELKDGKSKFSNLIIKHGFILNSIDNKRLSELFSTALIFRNKKKLVKKILGQITVLPALLGFVLIPFLMLYYLYPSIEFVWYEIIINYFISIVSFILIAIFLINFLKIIGNFEIKIGKTLNNLILFTLLAVFCSSGYFFYNSYNTIYIGVFSSYLLIYLIISLIIVEYIFESITDAYYFTYKVQITDALILESAYRLSLTAWSDAVKKKTLRQTTLIEIERLASLIEKDWSGHVLPADEKTNKWKNNTLIGIAASIRKNKRLIIIPSLTTHLELKSKFDLIFQKILKHDLNGLIDEEVPVYRIKKKSIFDMLQSLIVAVLPISISLSLNYLPNGFITTDYIHLSIIISSIWLLISMLLWFDPNLSDKISAIKSVKDIFKQGNDS